MRASLDLILRGVIVPQVEVDSLANLPRVLEDLHAGKVKSRAVLIPEWVERGEGEGRYRSRI